ncbi:hypothetical protein AB0J43_02365, partial [Nonomuraea fuscirosea]
PLSIGYLRQAAPGYGQERHRGAAPHDWFESAMAYLTQPLVGPTAVLQASAPPGAMGVHGYRVAGYLLQELARKRRFTPVPAAAWRALIDHVHDRDDLVRIADAAEYRMLFSTAKKLLYRAHVPDGNDASKPLARLLIGQNQIRRLRALADNGDAIIADLLVDHLVDQGRAQEAQAVLEVHGSQAISYAWRLADLLAEQGKTDDALALARELAADSTDPFADWQLAYLVAEAGRMDELRTLADAGSDEAAFRLTSLLAEAGRTAELRDLAHAGFPYAAHQLIEALIQRGRADEAITTLQAIPPAGRYPIVVSTLTKLLKERGETDKADAIVRTLRHTSRPEALAEQAETPAEPDPSDDLLPLDEAEPHPADHHLPPVPALEGTDKGGNQDSRSGAATGHNTAALRPAGLLAEPDAIDDLDVSAETGSNKSVEQLAQLGRTHELRELANAGHHDAARWLARLLAQQGHEAGLRDMVAAGHYEAADRLGALLAEQGQIEELRPLVEGGAPYAAGRLIGALSEQGQEEEADHITRFGLPLKQISDERA